MNWRRWQYSIGAAAALATGLLLRLWFVRHLALVAGDSLIYGDIAKNWLLHGVYGFTENAARPGLPHVRPTLIRLPGYPLFLAICFRLFGMEHYNAVLYVQIAADLFTCVLAAALAGRIWGSRAGLFVLWIAAVCPFTASYAAIALTETLVLTTIALSLYAFARWQRSGCGYNAWLWITALALACSILLRPEQVLFAASILCGMLWVALARPPQPRLRVRAATPVLAAAFCVVLPLIPWTLRNLHTFHVFQPLAPPYANDPGETPPTGFGRWYRTWAIEFASTEDVYWNYSGIPINIADLPGRAFDAGSPSASRQLRAQTIRLITDYNATTGFTPDVVPAIDARFAALATVRIHAHPLLYYVLLPCARLLDMMLRPRTEMMPQPLEWWKPPATRAQTRFCAAYAALNLAYFALGFFGFLAWKRQRWKSISSTSGPFRELAFAVAAAFLLRAALLLTLDNSEPRYTLEFFPLIFVCAGALLHRRTQSAPAPQARGR